MSGRNEARLKSILQQVPPGFLVDSRWLSASGVARSSAHDYHREGWLKRIARGVYRRPLPQADPASLRDWAIPVLSAQRIMHYDFHVGGATALALDGRDHYVSMGRSPRVYLYGDVPTWMVKLDLDADLRLRRRQLFGPDPIGIDDRDLDPKGLATPWQWPLVRSSPERAILEMMNELPNGESFHVVDMAFQSLTNLRPGRLMKLLAACRSVKVKRLFFLFADRHDHAWRRHIDREQVDLGNGPRALVEGGRYLPTYQLVVPEEFAMPTRTRDA